LIPIPDAIAPAEIVDIKFSVKEVSDEDMQDCLSAEARDDADEEIAVGLKEIERARVSVEKGEVKGILREFESGEK